MELIKVPVIIPDCVQQNRQLDSPDDFAYVSPEAASVYVESSFTGFILRHTNATRAEVLSFSWTNREEPCYIGHVHSGGRDILCHYKSGHELRAAFLRTLPVLTSFPIQIGGALKPEAF